MQPLMEAGALILALLCQESKSDVHGQLEGQPAAAAAVQVRLCCEAPAGAGNKSRVSSVLQGHWLRASPSRLRVFMKMLKCVGASQRTQTGARAFCSPQTHPERCWGRGFGE